jgi:hypothetical protein
MGVPKVSEMTVRIGDDQPYKNSEGGPAGMARAKYVAEVYVDPDYVAPSSSSSSSSSSSASE